MNKFILILCVLVTSGCASNCFEKAAIAKLTVPVAYKSAADAAEAGSLSVGQAKEVLRITDSADAMADQAASLCSIDQKTALDYINTINNSIKEVSEIVNERR